MLIAYFHFYGRSLDDTFSISLDRCRSVRLHFSSRVSAIRVSCNEVEVIRYYLMASGTQSTKHYCPCQTCNGKILLCWSTVRKHLKADRDRAEKEEECRPTDFLKSLHHHGRDQPLYDGAPVTLLAAVAGLLGLYSSFPGISQSFMTDLLGQLGAHILPKGNILPRSFKEAKSVIASLLIPMDKVEMCRNKCILYCDENKHLDHCPKCQTPRSPKFVCSFISPIPRLERWFSIPKIAETLQTHLPPVRSPSERMTDIQQSPGWARFMDRMGDPRCIGFGLNTDGVDPFNHNKVSYSMWPIVLCVYNLPPQVRQLFQNLLLVTIIPGPSTPGDMNPFMGKVVEYLLRLHQGVPMFDAFRKEFFLMRAECLLTLTDMPGGNKLYKTANIGSKSHACWICDVEGTSVKAYGGSRVLYLSNHQETPPQQKTKEDVYNAGRAVETYQQKMDKGDPQQRKVLEQMQKSTGKKGLEALARLPYYDPIERRPPEPMHGVQVVGKRLHAAINGHVDPVKTLHGEQSMGRFISDSEGDTTDSEDDTGQHSENADPGKRKAVRQRGGQKKANISHPRWALDKDGLRIADERCLQIKTPHSIEWIPKPFFSKPPYIKSHEWMEIATHGILKYAVRDLLGQDQLASLDKFLDCLALMCAPEISVEEAIQLKASMDQAIDEIEKHWPLCMQTIMMHMLRHVSSYLAEYGPAAVIWLFGPERFNGFMSGRIMKRDTPEVNIMETFRIYELTQLLAMIEVIPKGALRTDPVSQLRAVEAARRELGAEPSVSRTNALFDVEDLPQPNQDTRQEEEEEEGLLSSIGGSGLLTTQFRKPERIQLTDHQVALVVRATNTSEDNIKREATMYFAAKLRRPRSYVLSCAEVDKPTSHRCSSYIGVLSDAGQEENSIRDTRHKQRLYVNFGRVLYYMRVCINTGRHMELALVRWLATPEKKGGLWMVKTSEPDCYAPSLVPCELLPPPLVTAHDTASHGSPLFFLDANVSSMPML